MGAFAASSVLTPSLTRKRTESLCVPTLLTFRHGTIATRGIYISAHSLAQIGHSLSSEQMTTYNDTGQTRGREQSFGPGLPDPQSSLPAPPVARRLSQQATYAGTVTNGVSAQEGTLPHGTFSLSLPINEGPRGSVEKAVLNSENKTLPLHCH